MTPSDTLLAEYAEARPRLEWWGRAVLAAFDLPPVREHVHSLRFRMKSDERVRAKISRAGTEVGPILSRVHDLAGVRVLHLRKSDIAPIHKFILGNTGWRVVGEPTAYNPDDRFSVDLRDLGIRVEKNESRYSSIHYSVGHDSLVCEVQVRTLLEEVWGEVSHPTYANPDAYASARRHLELLERLCVLGSCVVEDLDHFTAKMAERDKLEHQVRDLQLALQAAKSPSNTVEVAAHLSQASGIAESVGRTLSDFTFVTLTNFPRLAPSWTCPNCGRDGLPSSYAGQASCPACASP